MKDPVTAVVWFLLQEVAKQGIRGATQAAIHRVKRVQVQKELADVFRQWRVKYGASHAAAAATIEDVATFAAQADADIADADATVMGDRFAWYEAIRAAWMRVAEASRATEAYYVEVHAPLMDLAGRLAATCRRLIRDGESVRAAPPTRDHVDEATPPPPFHGRAEVLEALRRFLVCDDPFAWWLVRGESGVGKSRLAHQLTRTLPEDWQAGFLDLSAPFDWSPWKPMRRTLWIVDRAEREPEAIGAIVAAIRRACRSIKTPVRVLLLDHAPSVAWARLTDPLDDVAKELRGSCHAQEPLDLPPLSPADSAALYEEVHGAPPQTAEAREVVAAGLPRWIGAGVDAARLLSSHLDKAIRRARLVTGFTRETLDLLALSCICGPLPLSGGSYEAALSEILGRGGYEPDAMAALTGRDAGQAAPMLSPQFLGDRFVIDHLGGPRAIATRNRVIEHAWRLGPDEVLDFVARNAAELGAVDLWSSLLARCPVPPPLQWIGAVEVAATVWMLGGQVANAATLLHESLEVALTSTQLLTHWLHGLHAFLQHDGQSAEVAGWLDRCWAIARSELECMELAEALALAFALENLRSPKRYAELVGRLREIATHGFAGATRLLMNALKEASKGDASHTDAAAEFLERFEALPEEQRRRLAEERVRVAYEVMRRASTGAEAAAAFRAVHRDIAGDGRLVGVEQLRCPDEERAWVLDHVATLAALACAHLAREPLDPAALEIGYDLAALAKLAPVVEVKVETSWLETSAQLVLGLEPQPGHDPRPVRALRAALVDAFAPYKTGSPDIGRLLERLEQREIPDID